MGEERKPDADEPVAKDVPESTQIEAAQDLSRQAIDLLREATPSASGGPRAGGPGADRLPPADFLVKGPDGERGPLSTIVNPDYATRPVIRDLVASGAKQVITPDGRVTTTLRDGTVVYDPQKKEYTFTPKGQPGQPDQPPQVIKDVKQLLSNLPADAQNLRYNGFQLNLDGSAVHRDARTGTDTVFFAPHNPQKLISMTRENVGGVQTNTIRFEDKTVTVKPQGDKTSYTIEPSGRFPQRVGNPDKTEIVVDKATGTTVTTKTYGDRVVSENRAQSAKKDGNPDGLTEITTRFNSPRMVDGKPTDSLTWKPGEQPKVYETIRDGDREIKLRSDGSREIVSPVNRDGVRSESRIIGRDGAVQSTARTFTDGTIQRVEGDKVTTTFNNPKSFLGFSSPVREISVKPGETPKFFGENRQELTLTETQAKQMMDHPIVEIGGRKYFADGRDILASGERGTGKFEQTFPNGNRQVVEGQKITTTFGTPQELPGGLKIGSVEMQAGRPPILKTPDNHVIDQRTLKPDQKVALDQLLSRPAFDSRTADGDYQRYSLDGAHRIERGPKTITHFNPPREGVVTETQREFPGARPGDPSLTEINSQYENGNQIIRRGDTVQTIFAQPKVFDSILGKYEVSSIVTEPGKEPKYLGPDRKEFSITRPIASELAALSRAPVWEKTTTNAAGNTLRDQILPDGQRQTVTEFGTPGADGVKSRTVFYPPKGNVLSESVYASDSVVASHGVARTQELLNGQRVHLDKDGREVTSPGFRGEVRLEQNEAAVRAIKGLPDVIKTVPGQTLDQVAAEQLRLRAPHTGEVVPGNPPNEAQRRAIEAEKARIIALNPGLDKTSGSLTESTDLKLYTPADKAKFADMATLKGLTDQNKAALDTIKGLSDVVRTSPGQTLDQIAAEQLKLRAQHTGEVVPGNPPSEVQRKAIEAEKARIIALNPGLDKTSGPLPANTELRLYTPADKARLADMARERLDPRIGQYFREQILQNRPDLAAKGPDGIQKVDAEIARALALQATERAQGIADRRLGDILTDPKFVTDGKPPLLKPEQTEGFAAVQREVRAKFDAQRKEAGIGTIRASQPGENGIRDHVLYAPDGRTPLGVVKREFPGGVTQEFHGDRVITRFATPKQVGPISVTSIETQPGKEPIFRGSTLGATEGTIKDQLNSMPGLSNIRKALENQLQALARQPIAEFRAGSGDEAGTHRILPDGSRVISYATDNGKAKRADGLLQRTEYNTPRADGLRAESVYDPSKSQNGVALRREFASGPPVLLDKDRKPIGAVAPEREARAHVADNGVLSGTTRPDGTAITPKYDAKTGEVTSLTITRPGAGGQPEKVELSRTGDNRFALTRDGKPLTLTAEQIRAGNIKIDGIPFKLDSSGRIEGDIRIGPRGTIDYSIGAHPNRETFVKSADGSILHERQGVFRERLDAEGRQIAGSAAFHDGQGWRTDFKPLAPADLNAVPLKVTFGSPPNERTVTYDNRDGKALTIAQYKGPQGQAITQTTDRLTNTRTTEEPGKPPKFELRDGDRWREGTVSEPGVNGERVVRFKPSTESGDIAQPVSAILKSDGSRILSYPHGRVHQDNQGRSTRVDGPNGQPKYEVSYDRSSNITQIKQYNTDGSVARTYDRIPGAENYAPGVTPKWNVTAPLVLGFGPKSVEQFKFEITNKGTVARTDASGNTSFDLIINGINIVNKVEAGRSVSVETLLGGVKLTTDLRTGEELKISLRDREGTTLELGEGPGKFKFDRANQTLTGKDAAGNTVTYNLDGRKVVTAPDGKIQEVKIPPVIDSRTNTEIPGVTLKAGTISSDDPRFNGKHASLELTPDGSIVRKVSDAPGGPPIREEIYRKDGSFVRTDITRPAEGQPAVRTVVEAQVKLPDGSFTLLNASPPGKKLEYDATTGDVRQIYPTLNLVKHFTPEGAVISVHNNRVEHIKLPGKPPTEFSSGLLTTFNKEIKYDATTGKITGITSGGSTTEFDLRRGIVTNARPSEYVKDGTNTVVTDLATGRLREISVTPPGGGPKQVTWKVENGVLIGPGNGLKIPIAPGDKFQVDHKSGQVTVSTARGDYTLYADGSSRFSDTYAAAGARGEGILGRLKAGTSEYTYITADGKPGRHDEATDKIVALDAAAVTTAEVRRVAAAGGATESARVLPPAAGVVVRRDDPPAAPIPPYTKASALEEARRRASAPIPAGTPAAERTERLRQAAEAQRQARILGEHFRVSDDNSKLHVSIRPGQGMWDALVRAQKAGDPSLKDKDVSPEVLRVMSTLLTNKIFDANGRRHLKGEEVVRREDVEAAKAEAIRIVGERAQQRTQQRPEFQTARVTNEARAVRGLAADVFKGTDAKVEDGRKFEQDLRRLEGRVGALSPKTVADGLERIRKHLETAATDPDAAKKAQAELARLIDPKLTPKEGTTRVAVRPTRGARRLA